MHLIKQFSITPMASLSPGDLFSTNVDGNALAIAMQVNESENKLLCVLLRSTMEATHPCWITLVRDDDVISYGSDWCLDLGLALGAHPGNYEASERPGTLAVSPTDVVLRAGGDGTVRMRSTNFSLKTFGVARGGVDVAATVYIRNWAIWLDAADRERHGGKPIFEHTDSAAA